MQRNQAASLARGAGTRLSSLTAGRRRRRSRRSDGSRRGVRRSCRRWRGRSREVSYRSETTPCSLSLGVSDRSEMTEARSCTVATSVPEECGHSVVGSTTTATNVGDCGRRNCSTSSALCRFDNPRHDLSNLSVKVEKWVVDCFQRFTCVDFNVQHTT